MGCLIWGQLNQWKIQDGGADVQFVKSNNSQVFYADNKSSVLSDHFRGRISIELPIIHYSTDYNKNGSLKFKIELRQLFAARLLSKSSYVILNYIDQV